MPRRASYIKNLAVALEAVAAAHPGKTLQLWCEDEAREGQKGRTGHRWFTRGERPPGRCDKRFLSTYLFAAVRPGSDDAFALVLPAAKAVTMDLFLARFAETLPAGVPAILLLDQAGWHGKAALRVPENVTLLPLPPYSPELNPVENVWQFMRENWLSNRIFSSYEDLLDYCCDAWNKLVEQPWRIMSLGLRNWAREY